MNVRRAEEKKQVGRNLSIIGPYNGSKLTWTGRPTLNQKAALSLSHPPRSRRASEKLAPLVSYRCRLLPSSRGLSPSRRRVRWGLGTEQSPRKPLPMLLRHRAPPCAPKQRAPSGELCGGSPAARCCDPHQQVCFWPANKNTGGALR
ncbi:hypothetical protein HU200_028907 [Digitaria exilis]|uniref:Uncharacterized protein n=1 Tax=Digitaria exilis TaxID=1010633 RepID=A0A835BRI7_9POAL|nr:hypothetical protein HU200_028907 [Digitaria exilis]